MQEDVERPPSSADMVRAARDAFGSGDEPGGDGTVREGERAVERPPSSIDLVQAAREALASDAEPGSEAAVREARHRAQPPVEAASASRQPVSYDALEPSDVGVPSPSREASRERAASSRPSARRAPARRPRREVPPGPVAERRSRRAPLLGLLALAGSSIAVIAGLLSEGGPESSGPSTVTTVTTTRAPATTQLATATSAAPSSTGWEIADPGELTLVGTATAIDGGVRLTTESRRLQAGAAWLPTKQPVANGFTTTFAFQLTDREVNPGDGFAFVIQNAGGSSLPPDGVASGIGYKGLPNSVAVEFDTTYQDYENDPRGNHIAVHTRGTAVNTTHGRALVGWVSLPGMRWHDQVHTVRIDYTPGTLTLFLNGGEAPILEVDLDLDRRLRLDDGAAWLGFTASTEPGFTDVHDILGWSFEPAGEG